MEDLPGASRRPARSPARSGADASPTRSTQPPRLRNLRLRQEFTEADRDKYLHDTFEFFAEFFEASLLLYREIGEVFGKKDVGKKDAAVRKRLRLLGLLPVARPSLHGAKTA